MDILYHLTILPPKEPKFDAVTQDLTALQHQFGGQIIYVNPNQHRAFPIPRLFFGLHKLREIRQQEKQIDIHHFFNPDLFPFPMLNSLKRPIVYSATGGVDKLPVNQHFFTHLAAITVGDERSLERLKTWGLQNVHLVRPGINTQQFSYTPQPLGEEVRLLVGSAPWSLAQFESKGIDTLLQATQQNPKLHLVCLWRGTLFEEMQQKVKALNLQDRVEILNRKVDVNAILATVHASVALAATPEIIRPYPYSLIESLAAGKPVLISQSIPMADYVRRKGCGKVIDKLTPESLLLALDLLCADYREAELASQDIANRDFSQQTMIETFKRIYDRAH